MGKSATFSSELLWIWNISLYNVKLKLATLHYGSLKYVLMFLLMLLSETLSTWLSLLTCTSHCGVAVFIAVKNFLLHGCSVSI